MLTCKELTERASDLLDDALPLHARLSLRVHLALCGMCRAYVDQLRKTRRLLGRQRLDAPDRATEDDLIERMTGRADLGGGAGQ